MNFLTMQGGAEPRNPKTTRGRQKIEIKEIKEENKRQVTFSKRRRGLFKKATELSVLCGAQVAIVTFSRGGRTYTFGSSDVDALLHKYLHGEQVGPGESPRGVRDDDVATGAEEEPWWGRQVESIPEAELEEYVAALRALKDNVAARIRQMGDRTVERAPMEYRPMWMNLTVENRDSGNPTVRSDRGLGNEVFVDQFASQNGY